MLLDGPATRYSTHMKVTIACRRRRLNVCAKRRSVSALRRRTWPGQQLRICSRLGTTISRQPPGEYYRRTTSCTGASPDALCHAGGRSSSYLHSGVPDALVAIDERVALNQRHTTAPRPCQRERDTSHYHRPWP